MRPHSILLVLSALIVAGCSKQMSTDPATGALVPERAVAPAAARPAPGQPGYEPAYVDGRTVTINAIEVPGKAPMQAQADFYEVIYPPDWQALGIAPPQCNPCDHDGNGIDMLDYHDHVLDSAPGSREYRAPWHVYAIVPAYNGDAQHDAAVGDAYKAHLPLKSEADINIFLASTLPGGAPLAVKVDTQFYFLCAVVGTVAAHQ
jgi:hypothetical protein